MYATEDIYFELTEYFNVRAANAESSGRGAGTCSIAIEDDDGAGAFKTWIDSTPSGDTDDDKCFAGETIVVKQQFTENVVVQGADVNVGLQLGNRNNYVRRGAAYKSGSGRHPDL